MGTLKSPILTLTAAYNHPLLPAETQYVVCKPVSLSMKRTLGCAVARNDAVRADVLRGALLSQWDAMVEFLKVGRFEEAKLILEGMMGRLENWVGADEEGAGEWFEMRVDVMRELEGVLTKILDGKGQGQLQSQSTGITRPQQALLRENVSKKRRMTSQRLTQNVRQAGKARSTPGSSIDSRNDSWSSGSVRSDTPTGSKKTKCYQVVGHRRESELVEEAIIRGEPVTLFEQDPNYVHPLPAMDSPLRKLEPANSQKSYSPSLPSRKRDSDVISIRSTLTLDQKYPFTPHRHRSRDITPTPTDPFGLRSDSRVPSSVAQSANLSPRKRAGIYATPRWPQGGRPSRSQSTSSEHGSPTQGRQGFGTAKDDKSETSIYNEINYEDRGHDAVTTGDADPAELIWRGIDEEYISPGGGGKFMKWRRSRRKVSVRTLDD
jgi:hypothetical protein